MTRRVWLLLVVLVALAGWCAAQNAPLTDADRQRAMQLCDEHKFADALPLLERLAAERPKDLVVFERLGLAVLIGSGGIKDLEARKEQRLRARKILLQAQTLGDNSNLLQVLLQGIPEDGSATSFSNNPEVEDVMRGAEAAFGRGDLEQALDGYVKAFALDPNLYEAPLFAGDACFKMHKPASACEWYARAAQVNPDRETAYRYWGDALVDMGEAGQARSKFIEAIVAQPYLRKSWMGAEQWAGRLKLTLSLTKIQAPHSVSAPSTGADGKTNINVTIDPAMLGGKGGDQDGRSAWFIYPLNRATWPTERFAKEFPAEKQYRHSLKEEAESLHLVADSVREQVRKKKAKKLDPDLALLLKLDDAGLIEPYVLIAAPDEGIAQDYPAYRAANRDKIRRYLDEFVVPKP